MESHNDARYQLPMPRPTLAPIYPTGPLNLNSDGTTISYKKSHQGPHAEQWAQADAEEMERLFTSGTLRPIMFHNIPHNKTPTYVNPVCSEKLKDDGAVKLRTRATIGGDRIDYPYSTTAVTAELESIKILIAPSRLSISKIFTWGHDCRTQSTSYAYLSLSYLKRWLRSTSSNLFSTKGLCIV
jgi:hypothetical protein